MRVYEDYANFKHSPIKCHYIIHEREAGSFVGCKKGSRNVGA